MTGGGDDGGAQGHDQGQKSTSAQGQGRAGVDAPGLHVTLEPAGSLREPSLQAARRGLPSRAVQHAQPPARRPQPEAQIGVLCDIVSVPTAGGAKSGGAHVIACAAQRKGQVQIGHAGQIDLEQGRVFEGELPVEEARQSGAAPSDAKRRLKAAQARGDGEARGGFAQLARVGGVLGVIDGHELAGGEGQGVVEGARLCLGRSWWDDQDPQPIRARRGLGCIEGRPVVGLQNQEGFELMSGIVDPRQIADQLGHDRGFVVKRGHDGVARPACGARRRRQGVKAGDRQDRAPQGADDEADLKRHDQRHQREARPGDKGGRQAAHQAARDEGLPQSRRSPCCPGQPLSTSYHAC